MTDAEICELYMRFRTQGLEEEEEDEIFDLVGAAIPGLLEKAGNLERPSKKTVMETIRRVRQTQRIFVAGETVEETFPFRKP